MASQKKLCVRSDGSFKVMQIADLQEIPAISPDTLKLMNAALCLLYTSDAADE